MKSVDYWWVVVLIIVVVLFFAWRPLMGLFTGMSGQLTNQDGYERGKEVFYDTELWGGKGSYKSCAMCHAADFNRDSAKRIEMSSYREGEPYPLKGISSKYSGGVLDTGGQLYNQVMRCLTGPDRMALGRVSLQSKYMQDLMLYLKRQ